MQSLSHPEKKSNTELCNTGGKIIGTALGKLAQATDGNRNVALNEAAYTLGGLVGAGSLPPIEAERMLLDTAMALGLSESEAQATIKSGLDAGSDIPFDPAGQRTERPPLAERKQGQGIDKDKDALKKAALRDLAQRRPDLAYHNNLNGRAAYVKDRWGLTDETIEEFKVGYCQSCPTSPYSDSITAPYYWRDKLINMDHRLISPNGGGKYRPEAKNLPTAIFNANYLSQAGGDGLSW